MIAGTKQAKVGKFSWEHLRQLTVDVEIAELSNIRPRFGSRGMENLINQ